MSDFDIAVQRLTAWLRDFGDQKPRPFVEAVTMVLLAARESVRQQAEIERLRAGVPDGFIGLTSELQRVTEQLAECRRLLREACDEVDAGRVFVATGGVSEMVEWVRAARAAGGAT